jgi:hypothetical protein
MTIQMKVGLVYILIDTLQIIMKCDVPDSLISYDFTLLEAGSCFPKS